MTSGGGYLTAPGCPITAVDCLPRPSKVRRGKVAIASPRRGTLTPGRIRHWHLRLCGTAERLGSRLLTSNLAPAHFTSSRLLGKSGRRVVVTGSYEATENLGPPIVDSGTLETERPLWSLTFTRIRH